MVKLSKYYGYNTIYSILRARLRAIIRTRAYTTTFLHVIRIKTDIVLGDFKNSRNSVFYVTNVTTILTY